MGFSSGKQKHQNGICIILHEIFHCLTRSNPQFRSDMYSLIDFRIMDEDFDIPENIEKMLVSNPDVEHHNACASFTINGKKTDCYLAFIYTKPFENENDNVMSRSEAVLVPLDGDADGKDCYSIDDAVDFWDKLGKNTIAPPIKS